FYGVVTAASWHVHAAVDVQGFAGDVCRRGSCQERYRTGDVGRFAQAGQRDLAEQAFARGFGQGTGHVGVDEARRDDVDRHAAAADFLGQRLAEGDDAGLGRGV